jgi:hypothetical protein
LRATSLALVALIISPTLAAAAERHVIPPGQDELVAHMLGGGEVLAGGCRLRDARIEEDHIAVSYDCDAGPAKIELDHPESAVPGAITTARFALVAKGDGEDALLQALAARLRESETSFVWQRIDVPAATTTIAHPRLEERRWLLLAALIAAAIGAVGVRPARRDAALASCAIVVAFLLRLALGSFGPFHVNGQGPVWLASAITHGHGLENYGPGYVELFGPIARLSSHRADLVIFVANAGLSAILAGLAFVLARLLCASRRSAIFVAALVAVDPFAIKFAATESYFTAIITLTVAAAVCSIAASRASRRYMVAFVCAAGLCAAQAARIHPMAWPPVALALLAPIAVPGLRRAAIVMGATSSIIVVTSWRPLMSILSLYRHGALMHPAAPPLATLLVACAGAAAVMFALRHRTERGAVLLAALHLLALVITEHNFLQSESWAFAYAHLYAIVPLVVLFVVIPSDRALPTSAFVVGLMMWFGVPVLRARTTEELEYRWLRPRLAALPSDCYVAHVSRVDRRSVYLPVYPPLVELAFGAGDRLDVGDHCVYYVHDSLCTSDEGRPVCDAFEHDLPADRLDATELPARPSFVGLSYDRSAVEVVLMKVNR